MAAAGAAGSGHPAAPPPVIAAVAVVGNSNQPLYFKSFGGDEAAKLQLSVFASLDMIAEKVPDTRLVVPGAPPLPAATPAPPFLGLLFPVEEHKVFGYITNSDIKIIVVVRDVLLREDKVRELFRRIHRQYVDAVCNPFTPLDGKITSPAFEEAVYRIVEDANADIEYRGPMPF
jgi:hypothetical protein